MTPADLRAIRVDLGLSQADMARALGLGKNGGRTVRRYEAGQTVPSGPVLKLYKALRDGDIAPPCRARHGERPYAIPGTGGPPGP